MIRVIQGTSGLDREMIQQMVNENKEALLIAQTNLADSEMKLKEIEEQILARKDELHTKPSKEKKNAKNGEGEAAESTDSASESQIAPESETDILANIDEDFEEFTPAEE